MSLSPDPRMPIGSLAITLRRHRDFLEGKQGGLRANLTGMSLSA